MDTEVDLLAVFFCFFVFLGGKGWVRCIVVPASPLPHMVMGLICVFSFFFLLMPSIQCRSVNKCVTSRKGNPACRWKWGKLMSMTNKKLQSRLMKVLVLTMEIQAYTFSKCGAFWDFRHLDSLLMTLPVIWWKKATSRQAAKFVVYVRGGGGVFLH